MKSLNCKKADEQFKKGTDYLEFNKRLIKALRKLFKWSKLTRNISFGSQVAPRGLDGLTKFASTFLGDK